MTGLENCPLCGVGLTTDGGIELSTHLRGGHQTDGGNEYRCPGVVADRQRLGLPDIGHGAVAGPNESDTARGR